MGLKKMLAQGIEEEKAQLAKASQTSEKPTKEKNVDRTPQIKEDPPVEEHKQKKKSTANYGTFSNFLPIKHNNIPPYNDIILNNMKDLSSIMGCVKFAQRERALKP